MPISKEMTKRQKELIEGIKEGMEKGLKEAEIAETLKISRSYVQLLKKKAGLTTHGSDIMRWVEEDRWLSDWIDEQRAERTKYGYAHAMRKYCLFRDKTPLELLKEAEKDNKLSFLERSLKHELVRFKKQLRKEGVSETTIKTYIAALQSFFKFHNVPLPSLKNGRVTNANRKNEYNREKVRELVSVCGPREKALFLTMFQSGLASNEVSNLKIRDLKEVKDGITILRLRRQKSGEFFTTFIGRDARKAIDDYLRLRNEGNLIPGRPDLSKLAKIKGEDDFIFVTWDPVKHRWGKISVHHISRYMLQACQKLGWEIKAEGIKRYNPNRPHALRASFSTILLNEGRVPKFFVDFMLGHALSGNDVAYFSARKNELFDFYKESEHLLSISELDKVPDTKYEELMTELHQRDSKIAELERKIEDIKSQKNSVDSIYAEITENPELKQMFNSLLNSLAHKVRVEKGEEPEVEMTLDEAMKVKEDKWIRIKGKGNKSFL